MAVHTVTLNASEDISSLANSTFTINEYDTGYGKLIFFTKKT